MKYRSCVGYVLLLEIYFFVCPMAIDYICKRWRPNMDLAARFSPSLILHPTPPPPLTRHAIKMINNRKANYKNIYRPFPSKRWKLLPVPLFISSSSFFCLSFRSKSWPFLILLTSSSSSSFATDLFLPVLLGLLMGVPVSALSVARQTLITGDAFSKVISFLKTFTGKC